MKFSDEGIAAILSGADHYRKLPLPFAPDVIIAVRSLTDLELDHCRLEGQRRFRAYVEKQGWSPVEAADLDPDLIQRLVQREILINAFYDPDTLEDEKPTPFFASDTELVRLGSVRVNDLYEIYMEHQDAVNPSRHLPDDKIEELIERLGKGPATEATLIAFDQSTLRRCVISMARRLYDSRTNK